MKKLNLFIPEKRKTISARKDKMACRIKECLSSALLRDEMPIIRNHKKESKLLTMVTITHIDLSPDLHNAVVFFVTLGGDLQQETLLFFELQTYYFKSEIARKVKIKYVPNIIFKFDNTFEYAQKINELLIKK